MESSLDLDAEIGLLEPVAGNGKGDNSFWEFYRPIMDDFNAKKRLVRTDPETTIRIFDMSTCFL